MSMGNSRAAADSTDNRISELPEPLLHHILCFLPQKEAVQTCVLSKSWRYLGSTRPKLEFFLLGSFINQTLLSIVDKTLQSYHDQKLFVQEFRIHATNDPKTVRFLQKWFPLIVASMSDVKTLDLSMSRYFDLPSSVFENSRSLRNLRLCGFRFSQNLPMDYKVHNLKHLQTLTLKDVHIVDETFQTIMSSCHYIEHLVLNCCEGLTTIRLMNHYYLKRFDLYCSDEYGLKEDLCFVDVPNLENMKIEKANVWFNFDRCSNMYLPGLKSLDLRSLRLATRPSLDILSRDFPCLQHFYIYHCSGFGKLRVSNCSIKHLAISHLGNSMKFAVDAPNMQVLDYKSSIPMDISFATTSNEWISKMKPWFNVSSEEGFKRLSKLLKAVSQSKIYLQLPYDSMNDKYYRYEEDNGNNDYQDDKPVPVEYLHLDYVARGYFYSEAFLNRMFRYCRPRNILEKECTECSLFLCKMLLQTPKEGSRPFSWQRDLEEVSIEVWDQNSKEWNSVEGTTFLETVAHLPSKKYKEQNEVWFKLKWREIVRPSHTIPISQSAMLQRLTVSTKVSLFLLSLLLQALVVNRPLPFIHPRRNYNRHR